MGSRRLPLKGHPPGRPLVLVVDDDALIRRGLEQNLRRLGCDVLLADDGNRALALATESHPAVIFLDLRMPGLDGYAVLRRLPTLGIMSSVVVMSGQGGMDDVIDAVRNGAIDYLRKPWKTTDLAAALGRALELHNAFEPQGPELSVAQDWPHATDVVSSPASGAALAMLSSLRQLARADTPALELIVRAVSADARLVRALVTLANAGARSPATFVETVSSAVLRLGAMQVHAVAEALALQERCQARAPALREAQERIWRFSVAKGISMRALAEVTGPEIALDPDRCCVSGLLMDIGATLLIWRQDGRLAASGEQERTPAVHSLTGSHAVVGQSLIGDWGLPGDLGELTRTHHSALPLRSDESFWCASVLGGTMAARLVGFDDPTWTPGPRADLVDRCAYKLGVGETVIRRLCIALTADLDNIWTSLI